ncbi:hypothetical protein CLOM_g22455 [Closterium sp. NIES-68]|nr:hypothetical protein CLOM_g22455 [Closterium sp. NIES-68]GJP70193.1 hypothetical protein CLOP_g1165 [Closterium sp. NIES-67]
MEVTAVWAANRAVEMRCRMVKNCRWFGGGRNSEGDVGLNPEQGISITGQDREHCRHIKMRLPCLTKHYIQ